MKLLSSLAASLTLALFSHSLAAQICPESSSTQLYQELLKCNTVGTVLYIAAHPDDENTRLISYLENERHLRVGYLSLTRGDGGQNLIGTEIGAGIGVLRTQELLAARRIDGAEQFFTRAVDFGYSKSSEETLEFWDREKILSDVVWVIRNFQPDVIITRFPPNEYAGHGHHSTSAILAEEAFDAAADPKRFPDQLNQTNVWQAKRLYFNTSTWWIKDMAEKAANDSSIIVINTGEYNAMAGRSYAGIAALSRSQHRSQGFGAAISRGDEFEYLQYVKGDKSSAGEGLFKNIDLTWNRLQNSSAVQQNLNEAISKFDFTAPEIITPYLINALRGIDKIQNQHWKSFKKQEIENLLAGVAGIWCEATAPDMLVTNGEDVPIEVNIISRGHQMVNLDKVTVGETAKLFSLPLDNNQLVAGEIPVSIHGSYDNPYWLRKAYDKYFLVEDQSLIGQAENAPSQIANFFVSINDYPLVLQRQVKHKLVDPVKAEIYEPVYIVPEITLNFARQVVLLPNSTTGVVGLSLKNHGSAVTGEVSLILPKGYSSLPAKMPVSFSKKGETSELEFQIIPGTEADANATIGAVVKIGDSLYTQSLEIIRYDHINTQIILSPAQVKVRNFELKMAFNKIGYIQGPGDEVAEYLRAAGFQVDILKPEDLPKKDLSVYPAILTGIRAFNTVTELQNYNDILNSYVENGGTWVVQYNTNRHLLSDQIGPYPFVIGRDRVTEEDADVKILQPAHQVFHFPNTIVPGDFEDWIQERGLYFAESWSAKFTPLIGWHDKHEKQLDGALLVAPFGRGHFVYTGISFFRLLPAGVPGSYRLLTNILSLSRNEQN